MPPIHHGIKVNEITTGARALGIVSTAVIGLVATASDADEAAFPLDTPVLVTDILAAMADAGVEGTLYKALDAIADITRPTLVVVRVAEGDPEDEDGPTTSENVIGGVTDEGLMTGLKALLAAEGRGLPRPRIIGAPGLVDADVAAELAVTAQRLNGMAYAHVPGSTVAEAITFAATQSARELMLLWPDFTGFEGDAEARALGLRAWIDQEFGWHKTISNVPVPGVTGLSRDVYFDVTGMGGDAKLLNDANITALVRTASGFRFWGNRTCSADPLFAFESAVRTAQVLRDTISDGLLWAIDKPLTGALVKDILDTINAAFRQLQREGRIIGANAWFPQDANPAEALAAGKLVIDYDFTPVAPTESLTLNQRITDRYYANLQIAA